jgi:hypothetical protein
MNALMKLPIFTDPIESDEKSGVPPIMPRTGVMTSLTSESTTAPNAAPMMTPTARSMTFPLATNSLNPFSIDPSCLSRG